MYYLSYVSKVLNQLQISAGVQTPKNQNPGDCLFCVKVPFINSKKIWFFPLPLILSGVSQHLEFFAMLFWGLNLGLTIERLKTSRLCREKHWSRRLTKSHICHLLPLNKFMILMMMVMTMTTMVMAMMMMNLYFINRFNLIKVYK